MTEAPRSMRLGELGGMVESLRPAIRRILARYNIPPQDAEDLLQTTLLLVVMNWSEIAMPGPWLLGTLQNRCLAYWRDRQRVSAREVPLDPSVEQLPEKGPTGQQLREQRLLLGELARHLKPAYRKVLVLRYQLGMVETEIAAATGLSPNSIRKTSLRAVEQLRSAAEASTLRRAPQASSAAEKKPARRRALTLHAGATAPAWTAASAQTRVAAVCATVLWLAALLVTVGSRPAE
jgi:RNA polymerase sigma factor (sigma-70 family)